jgi:RNA polymerase sigma factor (sigma-70 family)
MPTRVILDFLHHLRGSALLREGAEPTDGELLEAFVQRRDGQALECLVRRHAPIVWGVCRRTLAQQHDAEDAFQATFQVLLRKAATIRSRDLLANWLYRVAYQTAVKARQVAARRSARETPLAEIPEPITQSQDVEFGPEVRALLDEELNRLPAKYQVAVLVCDIEGRSRAEAAQCLGVPEGTVASRLARGRALLAKRLVRRVVGVSVTSLTATLPLRAASGSVPPALLAHTVKVTGLVAAGEMTAIGAISCRVAALSDAVLKSTTIAKQKAACLVLLLASVVACGGMVAYHLLANRPVENAVLSPPPVRSGQPDKEVKGLQRAWAAHLGRQAEEELDLGGGVKMAFILIPPGTFTMGSARAELDEALGDLESAVRNGLEQFGDEAQHEVTIARPFYLGKYPVTQEQYQQLTGKNPSWFSAGGNGNAKVQSQDTRCFPVELVSWGDATAFCRDLAHRTGRNARLPSEAEWEYACRAGTKTAYFFGDNREQLGDYAWYGANCDSQTHPVGGKKPNPWGLYDMHGNVWQWCADWFDERDPIAPVVRYTERSRVVRGGSWYSLAGSSRAARRNGFPAGGSGVYLGFRVAFSLD